MVSSPSAQLRQEMQNFYSDQEYIKTYPGINKQFAGKYLFNWPLINEIITALLRAKYTLELSENPYIRIPSGLEALASALILKEIPEIKNVEIPWHKVKEKVSAELPARKKHLLMIFSGSPDAALNYLSNMEVETNGYKQKFQATIKSNSDRNIEVAKKFGSAGESISSALKAARDLSADALCLAAHIVPLAGLAGAALKGVAKYQDEGGSMGAAMTHAAGEVVLNAVNAKKFKYTVIVASGLLDTTTNIIAGWQTGNTNIPEHGVNGIAKIAIEGGVTAVFSSGKLGSFFEKIPMPLKLNLKNDEAKLFNEIKQKATEKDLFENVKRALGAAYANAPLADRTVSGTVTILRSHNAIIKI